MVGLLRFWLSDSYRKEVESTQGLCILSYRDRAASR